MKSFARMTRLSSLSGRANYMSDPGRQEEIVLESDRVDWEPYHRYEVENQRSSKPNNEGREMMITLPNEWYTELPRPELQNRIDQMARLVAGDREYQWAAHWNKARTNFHVHIIFSERQKVKEPGRWDRDVYLSVDGKVARRKADRAKLDDGTFLPPIHRKGDLKDPFTAKDPKFATQKWLHECKQEIRQTMEQWGVKFERQPPLHEFHEGNGSDAPRIRMKNMVVRENNYRLDVLEQQGIRTTQLVKDLKAILKDGKVPLLMVDNELHVRIVTFESANRAAFYSSETRSRFVELDRPVPTQTAQEQQPAPEPEHKPVEMAQEEPERVTPPPAPEKPPERSDKKESEKEPAAPVERRGLIDLIRDLIASIAAQRAARASQKAAAEQQRKDAAEQAKAAVPEPQQLTQPAPEPERKPKLDDRIAEFEKQRMSMDNWNSQITDQRVRERTRNQPNVPDRNQKPRSHDHDGR